MSPGLVCVISTGRAGSEGIRQVCLDEDKDVQMGEK